MLDFIMALGAALVALAAISLRKTYSYLPARELRRQAKAGDELAVLLWRAVAYGPSLRLFLWLLIGFGSALSFVLLARVAPPVLGFVAVTLLVWFASAWLPNSRLSSVGVRLARLLTPPIAWLVGSLQPVLLPVWRFLRGRLPGNVHTGIYARRDLLDLLRAQKTQPDSRIRIEEIDLAMGALSFHKKRVRDHMVPRAQVVTVAAGDTISPVYLDELHQSLHGRFPVHADNPEDFLGTLYLSELTDISKGKGAKGKVGDHMQAGVTYINEADSLADVLHAYYATKRQLFAVINNFEEYVGIITLEDVLHQLLGKPAERDFDQHDSKMAVAARHKKPVAPDTPLAEPATATKLAS